MKIGKREKEILNLVAKGVLEFYGAFDPKFRRTDFYKDYVRGRRERELFKRKIKRLEEKDLIYLGGDKIKLSEKGKELLGRIAADDIEIRKTEWDGIWRLVAYDIPNEFKQERDYFRKKLKELDFYQIQKSLWAIPYECQEEIAIFAQSICVAPFVIYMTTDKIPNQSKVKEAFDIQP